jgi:hypothetical protein
MDLSLQFGIVYVSTDASIVDKPIVIVRKIPASVWEVKPTYISQGSGICPMGRATIRLSICEL